MITIQFYYIVSILRNRFFRLPQLKLFLQSTTFGAEVTYMCDVGYRFHGTNDSVDIHRMHCNATGNWTTKIKGRCVGMYEAFIPSPGHTVSCSMSSIGFQLLMLMFVEIYKSVVRSNMTYVSSVWMAASKTWVGRLDAIQRRAVKIIAMPEASLSRGAIQPLAQRRQVGAFTLFHRIYHGDAPSLFSSLLPLLQ